VVFTTQFAAPETLEGYYSFFGYDWKDKNKMTTIIGIHLILLGSVRSYW
jgi:hypothetical protein